MQSLLLLLFMQTLIQMPFLILLEIIGSMIIVVWGSSIWSQIRLRQAIKNKVKILIRSYHIKAPFYPLGPIIVITTLLFLLFGGSS